MDRNTIVAQATPLGRSGIAVVRLSGPESFNYTKEITHFSGETPHHTIRLLTIYDNKNRKIDEAIVAKTTAAIGAANARATRRKVLLFIFCFFHCRSSHVGSECSWGDFRRI